MRIFDTFLFDCELDLLEHRLKESYDLVDVFVLVEAGETFRGAPKVFTFHNHRDRFAWAAAKLRPIALDRLGSAGSSPWQRQALQRNAIMLGLRDASPDDVVLILDADEIPSRNLLQRLRAEPFEGPLRLSMTRHYEYLDQLAPRSACCPNAGAPFAFDLKRVRPDAWPASGSQWHDNSGVVAHFRDLALSPNSEERTLSAYEMRRYLLKAGHLHDAGRHLSAVDPAAHLETKLNRVSHAELGDSRGTNLDHLRRCRRNAVHHHGWWYAERPPGILPGDLERLAERFPQMRSASALPALPTRRILRSWAWLRFAPWLPNAFVAFVDAYFDLLLPLLAPLMTIADLTRAVCAQFRWRWIGFASLRPVDHNHG